MPNAIKVLSFLNIILSVILVLQYFLPSEIFLLSFPDAEEIFNIVESLSRYKDIYFFNEIYLENRSLIFRIIDTLGVSYYLLSIACSIFLLLNKVPYLYLVTLFMMILAFPVALPFSISHWMLIVCANTVTIINVILITSLITIRYCKE